MFESFEDFFLYGNCFVFQKLCESDMGELIEISIISLKLLLKILQEEFSPFGW